MAQQLILAEGDSFVNCVTSAMFIAMDASLEQNRVSIVG